MCNKIMEAKMLTWYLYKGKCNRVLQAGPWLFDGRLIIIKHCSPDSGLERDVLTSAPVWIRFPALHLKYWSQTILSKIASLVGVPLYMDKATTQFERLAYARSFVEISAKNHLPKCVHLEIEGGRQSQNWGWVWMGASYLSQMSLLWTQWHTMSYKRSLEKKRVFR